MDKLIKIQLCILFIQQDMVASLITLYCVKANAINIDQTFSCVLCKTRTILATIVEIIIMVDIAKQFVTAY